MSRPPASKRAAAEAYFAAIAEGDSPAALAVATAQLEAGWTLLEVLEQLVCAAQAEVGRRWAANEWSVAEEHRATSASEDVVAALGNGTPGPRTKSAVVGCVDGEWHALPARIVAAALRSGGWQVHFLGASVPVEHLERFLHDVGPDVTALSCLIPTALPRARLMIEASRDSAIPVLAGGPGFGPAGEWAMRLGANGTATSAAGALATLASPEWPRFCESAPPLPALDEDAIVLGQRRQAILATSLDLLAEGPLSGRKEDAREAARTEEDLAQLVDFLQAALFVDDPRLYVDFVSWMAEILEQRKSPQSALVAGIEAMAAAIDALVGRRAKCFLAAAKTAIGAG